MMDNKQMERNIANAKLLLEKAMPSRDFELIDELLSPDAPIVRAGFADLYALTGDAIPQEGNFRHWIEAGWKPLSSALTDMTSVATDIVASENTVMMKYKMTALHSGTFAGVPATNKRVEWEEIAVLHYNANGVCTSGWFMCQELSLSQQLGYKFQLNKK